MLLMNCPKCNVDIKSPFLAEIECIECWQCKEEVKVKDVFVSTNGFTIPRKVLVNRISHYKKLLEETEKDLEAVAKGEEATTKPQKGDKNFHKILKDLMLGARDNFRLDMPYDLYVQLENDNDKRLGKVINICAQGAAIELVERDKLPHAESDVKLSLLLPKAEEPLFLPAKIVWARKSRKDVRSQYIKIGIHYKNIDQATHSSLWNFIIETSSSPHQNLSYADTVVSCPA